MASLNVFTVHSPSSYTISESGPCFFLKEPLPKQIPQEHILVWSLRVPAR